LVLYRERTAASIASVMGDPYTGRIERAYVTVSLPWNRVNPYFSLRGKVRRKMIRWKCGQQRREKAKAAL
jgi:hypothetical protein